MAQNDLVTSDKKHYYLNYYTRAYISLYYLSK